MDHRRHRSLIALNAALLGVLGIASLAPMGGAGAQGAQRARGIYTMVGGEYRGGSTNAVYIVDAQNQELIAMSWSETSKSLEPLGYRNIANDLRLPGQPQNRK